MRDASVSGQLCAAVVLLVCGFSIGYSLVAVLQILFTPGANREAFCVAMFVCFLGAVVLSWLTRKSLKNRKYNKGE